MRRRTWYLPGSHAKPLVPVARRVLGATAALFFAGAADAEPQGRVAIRTSVCGVGADALWQETRFCNAVTGDVLLGRERNDDFGFGPYAEVSTAGFWDARYGGGLSVLTPVTHDFPLVLSFGAFGHEADAVALGGSAFFGLRSYNFHGAYNFAVGFVASGYRDLGAEGATLVSVGLEIDGFFLAVPFLFAAGELR
jgi:hypothetical protein